VEKLVALSQLMLVSCPVDNFTNTDACSVILTK
jgi:hypothetical protein